MKKEQSGQTLLEALIALATAVVVITAMAVMVLTSLNNAQFSKNQNQATQYAQQGMEFLKNLAQSDWASFAAKTDVNYCLSPLSKLPEDPSKTDIFQGLADLIQGSLNMGKREASGLVSKLSSIPQKVYADESVWRPPFIGESIACPGGQKAWTSFGNISSSDNYRAYASLSAPSNLVSNCLRATDFRFSIPSSASIYGIEVKIERRASAADTVKDYEVRIVKGGIAQGPNRNDRFNYWPAADTDSSYGSSVYLWELTWTPYDINASNFGVQIQAESPDGINVTAEVDYIRIKVYYAMPIPTPTPTSTPPSANQLIPRPPLPAGCGQNLGIFSREVTINQYAADDTNTDCEPISVDRAKVTVSTGWSDNKCTSPTDPYCHKVKLVSCIYNSPTVLPP